MKMKTKIILISLLTILTIQISAQKLTEEEKSNVLGGLIHNLEKIYPFPEVSEKTVIELRRQISIGFYNEYNSPIEFATQVTNHLEDFSNDKHLDLIYNPNLAKALLEEPISDGSIFTREEAKIEVWNNFGFKELSILDGNVGYLNLSVFFATSYAGKIADLSINYFSNCNALIIDLRQNGGGWDEMVNYLLGYLIDTSEPLLLKISRSTLDSSYYSAIVPNYIPGQKLTGIPVYILTSPSTASAAEAFTSRLKYFNKNVTIVGKKTKGAENPVNHIALNENFVLQIPSWKMIYSSNPEVWEGVGITPDIEVETKDAKKTAHLMALEKLISITDDKVALDKYQWALDGLGASYENVDNNTIKKFVGNYDKIKIIYKDSKLYYQYEERPVTQLIPISDNYFIVEGVDYFRIKFVMADSTIVMKQLFTYGVEREISKNK